MTNAIIAAAYALALIFGSPYVGQLRGAIRAAFPGQFRMIVGGAIALAVGAALVGAVARIRDRRAARYGLLAAALSVGIIYARVHATGNADVDVVERFHFVEYGLLTLLFHRVWRRIDDGSVMILPFVAGMLVATLDEWFQWLVPSRVGEIRDVALDAVAVLCGLCVSLAFAPPSRFTLALKAGSVRRVGIWSAIAVVTFALFLATIHLGHEITENGIGTFRSRYTVAELIHEDHDHRGHVAKPSGALSIEDQYLSEGLWHVQRRNQAWTQSDLLASWRENLILEIFFASVLDGGASVSGVVQRWPPEQRADAQARGGADQPYTSTANPYPIYTWPRPVFWTVIAAVTGALLAPTLLFRRR